MMVANRSSETAPATRGAATEGHLAPGLRAAIDILDAESKRLRASRTGTFNAIHYEEAAVLLHRKLDQLTKKEEPQS